MTRTENQEPPGGWKMLPPPPLDHLVPGPGRRPKARTTTAPSCLAPCVGCDTVQADHAPEAGVAQGIFHGILVRHHGRNQEEVEEGLGQEVKGQEEEDAQETTTCTCMDGMRSK